MKKTCMALALMAVGSAASAQSSVTIFGVLDVALRDLRGADSVKHVTNEGRGASRLGFRGVEDLGGGLKASFHLEHGLSPDTGAADSVFWQRRATVSLSGAFGEVRLGRHKWINRTIQDEFEPFTGAGMMELARVIHPLGQQTLNRANNQLTYLLPNMGAFYGGLEVAAGEGTSNDKGTAGRVGYKTKQFHVSFAYGQHGAVGDKLKSSTLGASYDFGGFVLQGQYIQNERGTQDQNVLNLSAVVKVGTQGKLIVNYANADGNLAGDAADATMLGLGYDHSLSRRTSLYATYGRIDNAGNTSTGANFSLKGASGAALPLRGGNSTGYEIGIRHNF